MQRLNLAKILKIILFIVIVGCNSTSNHNQANNSSEFEIITSASENGSISASVSTLKLQDVVINITPNIGFKIDKVIVDNEVIDPTSQYTFYSVNSSHSIHATFKPINEFIGFITGTNNIPPVGVIAVAAGTYHNLALKKDGSVVAWGNNEFGQTAVPIGLTNIVSIAAGDAHNIALKNDGTVVAWGDNSNGQINVPPTLKNVKAISAGPNYSVALLKDGTVIAWGAFGRYFDFASVSMPLGLSDVVSIASGDSYFCALKRDGGVTIIGKNAIDFINPKGLNGIKVFAIDPKYAYGLDSNNNFALFVLDSDHKEYFIEYDDSGMLDVIKFTTPKGIDFDIYALNKFGTFNLILKSNYVSNETLMLQPSELYFGVVDVDQGVAHGIALKSNGTVIAWGNNNFGQAEVPPELSVINAFTYLISTSAGKNGTIDESELVDIGSYYTVNITPDSGYEIDEIKVDDEFVTPSNTYDFANVMGDHKIEVTFKLIVKSGFLIGWGGNQSFYTSFLIDELANVIKVEVGSYGLVLKNDGTVGQWNSPYELPTSLNLVKAIAIGDEHSLALKSDGTIIAWGMGLYGETTIPAGLKDVVAISAGNEHSVVLKRDGTVDVWGNNVFGQTTIPKELKNVTAIAAKGNYTIALKADGTVVAWGRNDKGQCTVPAGLSGVVAIAAGFQHAVALKNDGTLVTWGNEEFGVAEPPIGLSNIIAISAGYQFTVALKSDGSVVAWGNNSDNQLDIPVGLKGVIGIAAGSNFVIAIQGY